MNYNILSNWLPNPNFGGCVTQIRCTSSCKDVDMAASSSIIVGGKKLSKVNTQVDLDAEIYRWSRGLRPVQWYPGHIAKTERELRNHLKLVDVVIEVRDSRIPMATTHPKMDMWIGNRKKILVMNREDMISSSDKNAWASFYAQEGTPVVFCNGKLGSGSSKLVRLSKTVAADVNVKRRAKGLKDRPIRAGIVGYPNVGKSSLINRLLRRRLCHAASKPGVTRVLKWVQFGQDLELMDSPGLLPMRIDDQCAAIKLAICDDIGERSYDVVDIAVVLVQALVKIPAIGVEALQRRYLIDDDLSCGLSFIEMLGYKIFGGDRTQAAHRILSDFRKGRLGWAALERPR